MQRRQPRFLGRGKGKDGRRTRANPGGSGKWGTLVKCLQRTQAAFWLQWTVQSVCWFVRRSATSILRSLCPLANRSVGPSVLHSPQSFSASVRQCISPSSGPQLACHWVNTSTSHGILSMVDFICAAPADPCLLLWSVLEEDGSLRSHHHHHTMMQCQREHHLPLSLSFLHKLHDMTVPIQPYYSVPDPTSRRWYFVLRALSGCWPFALHVTTSSLGVASTLSRWSSPLHALRPLPRSKVHLQTSLWSGQTGPRLLHRWKSVAEMSLVFIACSDAPSSITSPIQVAQRHPSILDHVPAAASFSRPPR